MFVRVLLILMLVSIGAASASAESASARNEGGTQLAQQEGWAVYWQAVSNPPQATVDRLGYLGAPWEVIGIYYGNWTAAWGHVCNLTRYGDSLGRIFVSPAISNGAIVCDGNCTCVPG